MNAPENIHATGLVLDKVGLILRGPSGAGKSLLALELMDEWESRGRTANLVSDDRIDIALEKGGVVMLAPKTIEGLVELRGRGIVSRPFVRKAPLHLVVDLVPGLGRMIEEEEMETELLGVKLTRCPVPQAGVIDSRHQLLLIREALRILAPEKPLARQKST